MPVAVVAVPALFAVVILLAGYILVEVIARTIGSAIPIPGLDAIGRWIANAIGTIINAMGSFLSDVARGAENLINVPVNALRGVFQSIANALGRFGDAIRWLLYTEVPFIMNSIYSYFFQALNYARGLVVQFYNYALEALQNVENYLVWRMDQIKDYLIGAIDYVYGILSAAIASALASAINFATGIYNTIMNYIGQVQAFLLSEINNAVLQLEHYAEQLANWAVNTAFQAAIAWAASYVNEAIGIAQRDLDAIIAGEMGAIWDGILTLAKDAIDAVEGGVDWIQQRLQWLESLPITGIASIIFALAGAISIPLEWVARCGTKLCSSLGGFGDEMDNLADDAIIAAIIALGVAAASDPKGMAEATRNVAAGPLRSIGDGFQELIHAL